MTSMGNDNLKLPDQNVCTTTNNNGGNNPRPRGRKMHKVNMPSGTKTSIVIPSKWPCYCSRVGDNLKLFTLKPDGKMSGREYKIVADEMQKTLPFQNIKMIQKVENCCLWTKFRKRETQIVDEWSARRVNERMLFHGSPHADAIVKTGFSLSKACAGNFSTGIYFASHSAKSHDYAGYVGYRSSSCFTVNKCRFTKKKDKSSTFKSRKSFCTNIFYEQCSKEYMYGVR